MSRQTLFSPNTQTSYSSEDGLKVTLDKVDSELKGESVDVRKMETIGKALFEIALVFGDLED